MTAGAAAIVAMGVAMGVAISVAIHVARAVLDREPAFSSYFPCLKADEPIWPTLPRCVNYAIFN
jgi:hypothetical protein